MVDPTLLLMAGALRDATGVNHRPGGLLVSREGTVLLAGPIEVVRRCAGSRFRVIEHPEALVMPALVNAHAHLDLGFLGPQPYEGDFVAWLARITELRLGGQTTPCIQQSVREGLRASHEQGVGYLGDIAGSVAAVLARRESPIQLPGVSYLECFGVGRSQVDGLIRLIQAIKSLPASLDDFALGISPHAPYTAGLSLYLAVARLAEEKGYPLCTHLAESPAEIDFVQHLRGPFVQWRKQRGKWDDTLVPTGQHPMDWLEPALRRGPWLVAHGNYIEPGQLGRLARHQASVVYCPRASAYFGFPAAGEHPYRRMLEAGLNVCLGTDSILCQPAAELEPQPHSILAQMRFLFQRDNTDPQLLLRMATTHGIRALKLPQTYATLQAGAPARLIQVRFDPHDPMDPLEQALGGDQPVEPLAWNHEQAI